jgi:hypothetical protein
MRAGLASFLLLLLASCATEPLEPAIPTLESTPLSTVSTIRPVEGECREYSVPITVGGKEETAYGRACRQADGTWQIAQPTTPEGAANPPGIVQSTVIYPAYPYYDPWWGPPWWGPPFGFFGAAVGFHGHHHHHHHGGHRHH